MEKSLNFFLLKNVLFLSYRFANRTNNLGQNGGSRHCLQHLDQELICSIVWSLSNRLGTCYLLSMTNTLSLLKLLFETYESWQNARSEMPELRWGERHRLYMLLFSRFAFVW